MSNETMYRFQPPSRFKSAFVFEDNLSFERYKAEVYNKTPGKLEEIDCPKCLNRGDFLIVRDDGKRFFRECSCMPMRICIRRMRSSGLGKAFDKCTFDQYLTAQPWQKTAKHRAMEYVQNPQSWFLACGQSGCGKTHLCTAICRELLLQGKLLRYMPWREEINEIKLLRTDGDARKEHMDKLKKAPYLYIDDLFKAGKKEDGALSITAADMGITFDILNYRYNNDLPTILSTELLPQELCAMEESIASRILEKATAQYILNFSRNSDRNYRMRIAKAI